MKVYTQEEFDRFEWDKYGRKICPSGDYSGIRNFPERCSFGEGCDFGEWSSFGDECRFGNISSFGEGCSFYDGSSFGERCSFGEGCIFGEKCSFGEWSSFGEGCHFGEPCSFENGRVKNGRYFACDRIGSVNRKTYFFADGENKMFVRAGCFFGALDKFVAKVKETHGGTKYERQYLSAVDLAKVVLLGE